MLIAKYYISDNELDGILHFITKKGNLGAIDLDKSVFRQEYELLRDNYEFYSPDYSTDSLKNNRIPDFRNTLYWNSDTNTDEKGKATVEFYSSDESADYIITVEGITPDGKSVIIDTESDITASDEAILDTNRRFRRFLDAVTGFSTKERVKRSKSVVGE